MKKTPLLILLVAGLVATSLGTMAFTLPLSNAEAAYRGGGPGFGGNGQNGLVVNGYAQSPLSETEQEALTAAILEEYGALNLYRQVIADFGSLAPFARIAPSEQQHVDALTALAEKYGVPVPANPGLADAPSFATLAEACSAGVDAEIADAALYDRLNPLVTHTDLLRVFANLQSASLNNHLPAFRACQ